MVGYMSLEEQVDKDFSRARRSPPRTEDCALNRHSGQCQLIEKTSFVVEGTRRGSILVEGSYANEYYMAGVLDWCSVPSIAIHTREKGRILLCRRRIPMV